MSKRRYITEIEAKDPDTGEMDRWMGQFITAKSLSAARKFAKKHGMGYVKVIGVYICDVSIGGDKRNVMTLFYHNERDN